MTTTKVYIWSTHTQDSIDAIAYATPELRDAAIRAMTKELIEEMGVEPAHLEYDKERGWYEEPYTPEEWAAMDPIVQLRAVDDDECTHDITDAEVVTA